MIVSLEFLADLLSRNNRAPVGFVFRARCPPLCSTIQRSVSP
jgi:hypothetical protein